MSDHLSHSSAPASGEGNASRPAQEQDRPAPPVACPKCGALMPPDCALGLCPGCLLNAAAPDEGSVSADSDRPTTRHPDRVKDYELLGVIGQGGMGVVYKARQVSASRTVALKMVLPALPSPTFLRRFQTEVQATARLSHVHIVPVYEVGEHEGHAFFTMPLVPGETLRQQLRAKKWGVANGESGLSKSQVHSRGKAAAILMSRVARAVQYAHDHGVFHRDLKPGNILVGEDGEPHLLDFGLAKITYTDGEGSDPGLTLPESVLGTPAYMAPEQANGFRNVRLVDDPALAGCDIYSMGVLLYELLTGQPPFSGVSPQEILSKVQTETPPRLRSINPWIDKDLETICLKCLDKSPRHRYSTAAGLAEDLERWLNKKPILARPAGPIQRTGRWIKRNPLGSALIFNLVVGLLVTLWFLHLIAGQNERIGQLGWAIFDSVLDDISTVADPFSGLEFVTIPRLSMAVLAGADPVIDDSDAHAKLTFGIAASREPRGLANDWSKILLDLEQRTSAKMPNSEKLLFELRLFRRGMAGDQILAHDARSHCDFTLISPVDYLLAKERQPGVRLLAALPDDESKGYVFFVRQDSSITNLAGLKGKIVGLGDPSSPATTFAIAKLALAGLDHTQLQLIETNADEGGNRIQIQAVLDGRYHAGVCTLKQFTRWQPKPPGLRKLGDEFPSSVPKVVAARAGLEEGLYVSLRDTLLDLPDQPLLGKLQPVDEADLEPLRQALEQSRAAFPEDHLARPTAAPATPQPIPDVGEPAPPAGP